MTQAPYHPMLEQLLHYINSSIWKLFFIPTKPLSLPTWAGSGLIPAMVVSCASGALTNAVQSYHSTKKIVRHLYGRGLIKRGLLEPSFFWWRVFLLHLRAKPADATKRGNLARFSRTREQGASKIKP